MWKTMVVAMGLVAAPGLLAACFKVECAEDETCRPGAGGTTTTGTSTGGHGGGGGGGSPDCSGEPSETNTTEECAVFVRADAADAAGDGTRAKPYKTLQEAIDKAADRRVYACKSAPFAEAVTLSAGREIYGGFDCLKGWSWAADAKSKLNGPADGVALTLASGADGATVENFAITGANAAKTGSSSIAVVVDQATAKLTRCNLVAGDAKDGEAGANGGDPVMQAEGGQAGGAAGPMGAGDIAGGVGGNNMTCGLLGGKGGNGGAIASGNGQNGESGDSGNGGTAGTGDTGAGCAGNPNGANGIAASFGPPVQGPGAVDASGYHGIDGLPGTDGTNGTSGGGGGGSKATANAHGAGGGGGGAGGCGGKHGEGGKAGGSSIALLSLNAKVTLAECKLTSGKGGKGGDGGNGQFGQGGGKGGDGGSLGGGASKGCTGGSGGDGGNGGNGSGALGGHSVGIALTGMAPTLDDATTKAIVFGTKGLGGKGGNMDVDMNHGPDGIAGDCWDFAKNISCGP